MTHRELLVMPLLAINVEWTPIQNSLNYILRLFLCTEKFAKNKYKTCYVNNKDCETIHVNINLLSFQLLRVFLYSFFFDLSFHL